MTDKNLLYKIVRARDKRYDGRFFCGVTTTGIYCRPICPAKPKLENIRFYRSSTEAEKAGFRPCLRCRPDHAPSSALWTGTAATVGRALSLIARGEADDRSIEQLAEKLGVSDRHLRRLFCEHVGASPIEVAASKRLHLAKQLIVDSNMPITEVAFASGYQSVRRFNEAFKHTFKVAPSSARKDRSESNNLSEDMICIEIPVIPPFDSIHLFEFLKNHSALGVESVVHGTYRRVFKVKEAVGSIEINFHEKKHLLNVALSISDTSHLRACIERARDLFDTRLNPHTHLHDIKATDGVAACYISSLGIRVPGAWDSFETAISIILGQLVSVEQASDKVKKLVETFGEKIKNPRFSDCSFLFPTAKVLAQANLKDIGITKVREHAIKELARLVDSGKLDLSRSSDIESTKEQLLGIKGIGPWTVEMIAMRCLGDTNAFPKKDLIIKRALEQHQQEQGDWSPWNSYVTLALWNKYALTLSKKGKKPSITKS